jgi:PPP family 3-phenylpropionic acid transporter
VSGIGFGLVMAISGQLYAVLGANSYVVMAGIAAIGALAGLMLDRRWHGEQLTT